MQEVYDMLTKDGIIGPKVMKDGKLVAKPFDEYPKKVTGKDGKRYTVKSLAEETQIALDKGIKPNDALGAERAKLAEQEQALLDKNAEADELIAKLKAQLAELQGGAAVSPVAAVAPTVTPPTATPKAPPTPRFSPKSSVVPDGAKAAKPKADADNPTPDAA